MMRYIDKRSWDTDKVVPAQNVKAKKSRLYHAFNGNAAGLRDVLIEHFGLEAKATTNGSDYAAGLENGRGLAYREVVRFLKKLVINDEEHVEDKGEPA